MNWKIVLESEDKQVVMDYNFLDAIYEDFYGGDLSKYDIVTIFDEQNRKYAKLTRKKQEKKD